GTAFRRVSTFLQSYLVRQCCKTCLMVLRGTPCEKSETVSCSGSRVTARRCLRSASAVSGNSTRKGRIEGSPVTDLVMVVILGPPLVSVHGHLTAMRLYRAQINCTTREICQ